MKRYISVFIVFAANSFLFEVSSKWHSRRSLAFTKFRGFSWGNCGKPDDPTYVKTLHVYPNPIPSPGYVMAAASANTSVDLRSPFPVNVTLEKDVAGVWVKVPCVDDVGSCYYPDACEQLAQLFMTFPELCPQPKRSFSVSCGCPFRAGDYNWPSSGIYIPNFSLPKRLTNFRLQIVLGNSERELGCLKVNFSIASVLRNQHNEM